MQVVVAEEAEGDAVVGVQHHSMAVTAEQRFHAYYYSRHCYRNLQVYKFSWLLQN